MPNLVDATRANARARIFYAAVQMTHSLCGRRRRFLLGQPTIRRVSLLAPSAFFFIPLFGRGRTVGYGSKSKRANERAAGGA